MSQAQRKPREKEQGARSYGPYKPSTPYKKPSGPLHQLASFWRMCFPPPGNPPRNYYEQQQRRCRTWFLVLLAVGVAAAAARIYASLD
ncbi:hypothetical protein [Paludisphaera rhizosphaerae]|uniref:hypothetical protein n=1 Tax=Paludisphaera rhizosphaerae TaxID=2711216 RepID=UPI0013EA5513|nr:hypothetical protein [Paludisphaera rhizosphaerae]